MAAMRMLRRSGSERGAELIEMAMVMPILLIVVGGIVDFGFVFRTWQVITNAAREGARVGVLPNYSCTAGPAGDVQPRVDTYLSSSGVAGAVVQVSNAKVAGVDSCTVVVTINQPLPSLGVFGRFFGGNFGAIPLQAAAVMRSETQAP